MWWWLWVVWVLLLIWLVIMPFGWGYRRWGRPYDRARRGGIHARSAYDAADHGWSRWGGVISLILAAAIVWLVIASWL